MVPEPRQTVIIIIPQLWQAGWVVTQGGPWLIVWLAQPAQERCPPHPMPVWPDLACLTGDRPDLEPGEPSHQWPTCGHARLICCYQAPSGRLVVPDPAPLPGDYSFYLVVPVTQECLPQDIPSACEFWGPQPWPPLVVPHCSGGENLPPGSVYYYLLLLLLIETQFTYPFGPYPTVRQFILVR